MKRVLAIDSGGTKTEALLVGLDGAICGGGRSRPKADPDVHPHELGYGRSSAAIMDAVCQALEGQPKAALHVGVIGNAFYLTPLEGLPALVDVEPMTEVVPAFTLAGESCGVVALAGTGAFVHVLHEDGRMFHLDGLGPLAGDHGGAFGIGLAAIRAVAQADWHPRRMTTLANVIYSTSREKRLFMGRDGLVKFMLKSRDRAQVAAFAALVDQEARKGDRIACEILATAAADIAETVRDAASPFAMTDKPYALIGIGSVMTRSDYYWDVFVRSVAGFAPAFRPIRIRQPAVAGIALHVLSRLDGVDYAAARRRLLADLDALKQKG